MIPAGHLIEVRRNKGFGWTTAYEYVVGDAQACVRAILSNEIDGTAQSVWEIIPDEGSTRNATREVAQIVFWETRLEAPKVYLADFLDEVFGPGASRSAA